LCFVCSSLTGIGEAKYKVQRQNSKHEPIAMPSIHPSNVAATARAFATYSLVPYLGILFCPGAVLVGGFGIVSAYRSRPEVDETSTRICYISVLVGIVILAIQMFLWWILYKVPVWAKMS
jgi:hypothetical protein